jgi:two-component system, chemotaxis family, CheB/CheR fusion protein
MHQHGSRRARCARPPHHEAFLFVSPNNCSLEYLVGGRRVRLPLVNGPSADPKRIRIEGEPVILPADVATPLDLILHELATNAGKYGALSRKKGTVSVTWPLKPGNRQLLLRVVWEEQGGPAVKKPAASGFGSTLIRNGLPTANVQHTFGRNGVVCKIELPLRTGAEEGDTD